MASDFDFLSVTDKPALIGLSTLEWQARTMATLIGLGYKVHTAENHEDFMSRFTQFQYQLVVIEELFDCDNVAANESLRFLQNLQMSLRRHAVIVLLGDSFQTMNTMQAFAQSVHVVVHSYELEHLEHIIHKVVADNDLFLQTYRDVQNRIAQGNV